MVCLVIRSWIISLMMFRPFTKIMFPFQKRILKTVSYTHLTAMKTVNTITIMMKKASTTAIAMKRVNTTTITTKKASTLSLIHIYRIRVKK